MSYPGLKPWSKGQSGNSKGRPKGALNTVRTEAKTLFENLVALNAHKVQEDWDRVREEHPDKALLIFMQWAEYVFPKLARHEHTGRDGGPVRFLTDDQAILILQRHAQDTGGPTRISVVSEEPSA